MAVSVSLLALAPRDEVGCQAWSEKKGPMGYVDEMPRGVFRSVGMMCASSSVG